jgi:hypothetical protein
MKSSSVKSNLSSSIEPQDYFENLSKAEIEKHKKEALSKSFKINLKSLPIIFAPSKTKSEKPQNEFKKENELNCLAILPERIVTKFENRISIGKNNQIYFYKHKCNICFEKFTSAFTLSQHKLKHKKNARKVKKRHKCRYCDKIFTNKNVRKSHEVTHDRVFECKRCDIKFRGKKRLFVL